MSRVLLLLILFWSGALQAANFCFARAETYYEQVFCEVSAKGNGKHLPNFYDFRKNDQLMQALLLKKPALHSGITLAIPSRASRQHSKSLPKPTSKSPLPTKEGARSGGEGCQFNEDAIICQNGTYQLTGNKNNNTLGQGVFDEANKMGIVSYEQPLQDKRAVNEYLLSSYHRYIRKMLDIGLGAVTMSSGKFAFLFHDHTDRGVSFSARFETMYRYLKKDKSMMRVDERVSLDQPLQIENCLHLGDEVITCPSAKKNYLFIKVI